ARDSKAVLAGVAFWLTGHLMNSVGLTRLDKELARFGRELVTAAPDKKDWNRAQQVDADCPLTGPMEKQLADARTKEALLRLVDEWMDVRSPRWLLGWRDICRSTDERTVIASVVPRAGVGHTMPLMVANQPVQLCAALLGNIDAIALDYI